MLSELDSIEEEKTPKPDIPRKGSLLIQKNVFAHYVQAEEKINYQCKSSRSSDSMHSYEGLLEQDEEIISEE